MPRRPTVLAGLPLLALALVSVTLLAQPPDRGGEAARDAGATDPASTAAEDESAGAAPRPSDAGVSAQAPDGGSPVDAAAPSAADVDASSDADGYEPLAEPLASCVRAFRAAQKLRRGARLRASRQQLLVCAHPRCPNMLTDKCVPWLREVDAAMPSIVIAATDPQGRETARVRVIADGQPLRERLDGRPVLLDPGDHLLRFEHPGSPVLRRRVVLSEGEQGRRVELAFSRLPTGWGDPILPPVEAPVGRASSVSPWALGAFGVAGAGLVVGIITGIVATDELADIEQSCPDDVCPTHLQDDFDDAATVAHVSTGSFVVAGVGAAVGLVALLAAEVQDEAPSPDAPAGSSPRIEAAAGPGGIALWGWF